MEAMHTSMGLVAPHPGPVVSMADQVNGRRVPTKVISAAGSTLFPGSRRLKCGIAPQRRDKTAGRRKIVAVSAGEVSDRADSVDTAVEPEPIETEEASSSGVMFMTDDSSEIEKAIRKIEAENQALREKVALAKLESLAEPALETEGRSVDVTRPRLGAVAPSLAGVQAPAPSTLPSKLAVSDSPPRSREMSHAELARTDLGNGKPVTDTPMSIVFVASEVAPYSKTGGLGDVIGALPQSLAARGHRVMVVAPRYMNGVTDHLYDKAQDAQCRIKIACFGGEHEVAFFHEFREGVDFVFVDHPSYHRPGTPYGDTRGAYGDNQFRFTILNHAACEAPLQLALGGFTYGENVIFVANDWHAGLVPVLVASKYRRHGVYLGARSILAIHNMSHQGVEPGLTYPYLGLPPDWYGALEWVFPQWARAHELDKGEAVNILKGAVVTADRILTVSQGYAWEITTVEGGWGLDGLLRSRNAKINGITNGVDVVDWNPATDVHIPSQYSLEDLSGKAECKAALQRELGLPVRPEVPLIGFIGRLDFQKGPDIIQASLSGLFEDDVQLLMLGSGEAEFEEWMKWAEEANKEKFRGWVGFSVPMAHRITAGCDILLMPSRFEPCGLNQLYAMRYGTVPVAHSTGGLRAAMMHCLYQHGPRKAIFDLSDVSFLFWIDSWTFSPLSSEAMLGALWTAIGTYRNHPESWKGIMTRGMSLDMSWEKAALQYEQVFQWAMTDPPYA